MSSKISKPENKNKNREEFCALPARRRRCTKNKSACFHVCYTSLRPSRPSHVAAKKASPVTSKISKIYLGYQTTVSKFSGVTHTQHTEQRAAKMSRQIFSCTDRVLVVFAVRVHVYLPSAMCSPFYIGSSKYRLDFFSQFNSAVCEILLYPFYLFVFSRFTLSAHIVPFKRFSNMYWIYSDADFIPRRSATAVRSYTLLTSAKWI